MTTKKSGAQVERLVEAQARAKKGKAAERKRARADVLDERISKHRFNLEID